MLELKEWEPGRGEHGQAWGKMQGNKLSESEAWREERGGFKTSGMSGNWQQRLRQLKRYTDRKREGLGT